MSRRYHVPEEEVDVKRTEYGQKRVQRKQNVLGLSEMRTARTLRACQ